MNTADTHTDPRTARRIEAYRLCTAERAPAADYLPGDTPFFDAWTDARHAAAGDRTRAVEVLDTFLKRHWDDLRDLAVRARDGRAPGPVLDDIAQVLAAVA